MFDKSLKIKPDTAMAYFYIGIIIINTAKIY